MAKQFWTAGLASIAALAITAIAPVMAQEVVNYGVQPSTQPIYIARGIGLLDQVEKKHNIKIVFRSFSYGAPQNQAMASGDIQMASGGMGPAMIAAARLPSKLLAITALDQSALLVLKDSPIKSAKDWKGKTIAYPGEGSQQYPLLLKALADVGLKESDIKLFKTKGSDIGTLLRGKSVDAGITWDPHVSYALIDGDVRVLLNAGQIMPIKEGHFINNAEWVHEGFLAKHPRIVQDLMIANVKAIDYILKDPKSAAKIWSEQIGLPLKVLDYSITHRISVFNRNIVPDNASVQTYIKFLKNVHILKPEDAPKIDASFAEKAFSAQ